LFQVYIALITDCIGKTTRASLAKRPGGNKRVCVHLCAPGTAAGLPGYIPTIAESHGPTRLIEQLDEPYFDFLDRLSSTACTEGLTGLSLR
jgi:hypothetical protein